MSQLTVVKINAAAAEKGLAIRMVRKGKRLQYVIGDNTVVEDAGTERLADFDLTVWLNDMKVVEYRTHVANKAVDVLAKTRTEGEAKVPALLGDGASEGYDEKPVQFMRKAIEEHSLKLPPVSVQPPHGKRYMSKGAVINAAEMIENKRKNLPAHRRDWYCWVELQDNGVNYVRAAATLKPAFEAMNLGKVRIFILTSDLNRYSRSLRSHARA